MAMTPKEHQERANQHAAEGTANMAIYHTLACIAEALEDIATTLADLQEARTLEGIVAGLVELTQATYGTNP